MEIYNQSSHRVYSMKAHIVLCTKYRYKIITPEFDSWLGNCIKEIMKRKGGECLEVKGDLNHIHILVRYNLFESGEEIIRAIKQWSNKAAYKSWGEYLKGIYRGERLLWSGGAFMCSTGQGSEEIVANYIKNQGLKKLTIKK